jgi:hypothetical protein
MALRTTGRDPSQVIGWNLMTGFANLGGALETAPRMAFYTIDPLMASAEREAAVIELGWFPTQWRVALITPTGDPNDVLERHLMAGLTSGVQFLVFRINMTIAAV